LINGAAIDVGASVPGALNVAVAPMFMVGTLGCEYVVLVGASPELA
jgi:hypothetical protein